jgi:hypothetical protein
MLLPACRFDAERKLLAWTKLSSFQRAIGYWNIRGVTRLLCQIPMQRSLELDRTKQLCEVVSAQPDRAEVFDAANVQMTKLKMPLKNATALE